MSVERFTALEQSPATNRYFDGPDQPPSVRDGWTWNRLTSTSRLYGANGVTLGPDQRLYVAQFMGNRVSAITLSSGSQEVVVPFGSPISAPDDTAFDSRGTMYITEPMPGRVWACAPGGQPRLIADNLPSANGITCDRDRVLVNENRDGGRLLEVFADGRDPQVLATDLPHPNAMAVGPDGLLYIPMFAGEVWRMPLKGATAFEPERFIDGLVAPPAARFDADGQLVVVSSVTGEVTRIDLVTRRQAVVATLAPGLDNVACHPDGRMFTSHFISGQITEISRAGTVSILSPAGFIGPAGIAVSNDGELLTADSLGLIEVQNDGGLLTLATLLDPGFPGVVRGLATGPNGLIYMTTTAGEIVSYDRNSSTTQVLASGYRELMDVDVDRSGNVFAAEAGGGRVIRIGPEGAETILATGLARPTGVALLGDSCFVSEAGAGRITRLGPGPQRHADGFGTPEGLAVVAERLYVLDVADKELIEYTPETGECRRIASGLPVGSPPGRPYTVPAGDEVVPGPLSSLAALTVDSHGVIYISANGEGAIHQIAPERSG